ncbi:efflux RND transporter periplasmic adaptor subunit [Ferviditalea candida]|uniref:Efflux RND transporter periplasmic adaptor subunit n=1 Tax=Ferviditalea candida TaxID=3108399 RepID=A0ABU5ZJ46_9BACL|nr:efflux RND transporter periplasmic adaptor subunit [Paenibacillaceae bacterium T2]
MGQWKDENRMVNRSRRNSLTLLGLALLCMAIIAGCSAKPANKQAALPDNSVKMVKVAKIAKQKIADPVEQVADVLPSASVNVVTKVGADVLEVVKQRGDRVKQGDPIIKLDPTDMQLQRDKAASAVSSAQEALTKAAQDLDNSKQEMQNSVTKLEQALILSAKNLNKTKNDYDLGQASKTQLDQAQNAYDNAKSDLDLLKQKQITLDSTDSLSALKAQLETSRISLDQLDRSLSFHEVTAPIGGVLTDLPVEKGMTLPAGFQVGVIQQLDPVKIRAYLTPSAAQLVRGKTELSFSIPGSSDKMKGRISYLSDVMSMQTKSYELDLSVPNPDLKLTSGMKVQVELSDNSQDVVVTVPSLSIVREEGNTYVFVLVNDHVEKRKVELGRVNDLNQEVLSGVKEGELLVVSGQNRLKDREKVQISN